MVKVKLQKNWKVQNNEKMEMTRDTFHVFLIDSTIYSSKSWVIGAHSINWLEMLYVMHNYRGQPKKTI